MYFPTFILSTCTLPCFFHFSLKHVYINCFPVYQIHITLHKIGHSSAAYYNGYMDQRGPPSVPGYYPPGPGGFGNVPLPQLMRGQQFMEPSHIIPSVDYVAEQFQG